MKFPVLFRLWQRLLGLKSTDDPTARADSASSFTCGTLRYTPASLAVLFGWLLWGDFTMTLMESLPPLLVIQLKDHQVSNQAISFLMVTIFQLCNLVLNPVISYSSDRHRSRWGRRRPFLLLATPFVAFFLMLIPWSPEITRFLEGIPSLAPSLRLLPIPPLVLVFAILIVAFQVFHMFIATVYYYLIPDTVPEAFLGRFYGLFRVFGIAAGMGFNWFVFPHAHEHMRIIFFVFALLYAFSFLVMCTRIKEGQYEPVSQTNRNWSSAARTYLVECFSSPRFLVVFLVYASIQWARVSEAFSLLFYRDNIGFSEVEYGRFMSVVLGLNFLLSAPFGFLVDRLGSQRALLIGLSTGVATGVISFFAMEGRLLGWLLGIFLIAPGFLVSLAMGKWTVDMYPRSRYGQFASAAAMLGALGSALLSPLVGTLVDAWGNYYRMYLIFPPVCYAVAIVASLILLRMRPAAPGAPPPESSQ